MRVRQICLVNGSLRGKEASSLAFLSDLGRRIRPEASRVTQITVPAGRQRTTPERLAAIAQADALVFAFPVHAYCLPGALMKLLEDYYRAVAGGLECKQNAKVYAIVNSGFPRPAVCREAVAVVRHFCRRVGLNWRFGVSIGCGPVAVMLNRVPFLNLKLKRAFSDIVSDIELDDARDVRDYAVQPIIPERILIAIKNRYERRMTPRSQADVSRVASPAS